MIVRRSLVFLVVVVGLAQSGPAAHAQFFAKVMHSIAQDTKRNNCWPNPFVMPDRRAVRTPMEIMVQAGWERQNLLSAHHFDEETGELTEAGELKVQWIATRVPSQHRVFYVSRAQTPKETSQRIDAVKKVVIEAAPEKGLPRVLESQLDPGGWPAGRVDTIGRKFNEGMPDPQLPDYEPSSGS